MRWRRKTWIVAAVVCVIAVAWHLRRREPWPSHPGELRVFTRHWNYVTCASFLPDNHRVLSVDYRGSLWIWDVDRRKSPYRVKLRESTDYVALSPDGSTLAGGFPYDPRGAVVRFYDTMTGKRLREVTCETVEGVAQQYAFAKDLSVAIVRCGLESTDLAVINLHNGEVISRLSSEYRGRRLWEKWPSLRPFAVSPSKELSAGGVEGNAVAVWTTHDGCVHRVLACGDRKNYCLSLAFSGDSRWLVAGYSDGCIQVHDLKGEREGYTLLGHKDAVVAVACSADGTRALSGDVDHTVRYWDLACGTELQCFVGHDEQVVTVAFSPDELLAVSGGATEFTGKSVRISPVRVWTLSGTVQKPVPGKTETEPADQRGRAGDQE